MCLALFESALVSYFSDKNHHQMAELVKQLIKKHNRIGCGNVKKSDPGQEEDKERSFHDNGKGSKVLRLHKMARVLLPAGFLMFNMVYWIYYL